jgi:ubiquinone biosynthesis protein
MTRRAQDATMSAVRALGALPGHLDAIGRKARHGRLEVQFVHRNLEHFEREMDRSSNRLALALIIAAIVIGSSLITQAAGPDAPAGSPLLGLIGFGVAGLFGIGLAIGIVRSGRL